MFNLRHTLKITLLAAAAFITGCAVAPPEPISATPDTWTKTDDMVIGITVSETPAPDVYFPGAGCLLCIAAAETANAGLSKQVATFSTDPLDILPEQVVALIEQNGARAVLIEDEIDLNALPSRKSEDPNATRRDYSSLAEQYNITHLLDLDIHFLGLRRTYSAYVPTDDPVALLTGRSALINLASQTYEVYQPLEVIVFADGEWKEPPNYPGLTNAYYQMLEESKLAFTDTLKPKVEPDAKTGENTAGEAGGEASEETGEDELAATDSPQETSVQ